jgi:anti-anti-sigma regulatory factor
MMKITRAANGEVVFALIGRMEAENIGQIEALIREEEGGRRIVFDLKDLTLVDQDVVVFFRRCEADSIKLENCAGYIREWMKQEKG